MSACLGSSFILPVLSAILVLVPQYRSDCISTSEFVPLYRNFTLIGNELFVYSSTVDLVLSSSDEYFSSLSLMGAGR
ncbi:hypothetical protein B9Z19DRAFT_1087072 [Tuber borchii]|uniref:Secreted protein n=1 Tax=Tuber borchii TaxID=42251 RepID=A0A2T6ZNM2_TUBBO|nr:hypothetical protein B9Z19DRAFT_1087072 [Tuber borchii]